LNYADLQGVMWVILAGMKALIPILLSFLLVCSNAQCQNYDLTSALDKILLLNVNAIAIKDLESKKLAYVEQIKEVKPARSVRKDFSLIFNNNQLSQSGLSNREWVKQKDGSIELLLQQIGDINFINFIQRGDFSNFIIGQSGTGNVLDAYIFNQAGRRSSGKIIQDGNYNQIEMLIFGGNELDIFQKGDNHSLNVLISGENSYLRIYQEQGMRGEGMRLNVFTGN
jgi:hypothetical protein